MKFCVIANPEKYTIQESLERVVAWCESHNCTLYLLEKLHRQYPEITSSRFVEVTASEEEAVEASDIVVALGGDGTMLHTAHLVKEKDRPVLGVNSGRLGFMANIQPELVDNALTAILKNDYYIDERKLLKAVTASGSEHYALNEFLFTKKDSASLITLTASYNGQLINHYWADGLIISTPTGSTAYNLSAGGPIILPSTSVVALTPIHPHTLTTRPLILPSDGVIRVRSEEDSSHLLFSYDGKMVETGEKFDIEIKQGDFSIQLIQFPGYTFFKTLRNKLMWGMDKRKI